jgi:hypothetical protein
MLTNHVSTLASIRVKLAARRQGGRQGGLAPGGPKADMEARRLVT